MVIGAAHRADAAIPLEMTTADPRFEECSLCGHVRPPCLRAAGGSWESHQADE